MTIDTGSTIIELQLWIVLVLNIARIVWLRLLKIFLLLLLFCEARGNVRIFLDHSSNEILSAVRLTGFNILDACPFNQEGLRCERRLALVNSYIER